MLDEGELLSPHGVRSLSKVSIIHDVICIYPEEGREKPKLVDYRY